MADLLVEYAPPAKHRLGRASGRQRTCTQCARVEIVRQDNAATICGRCSRGNTGRAQKRPKQIALKLGKPRARRLERTCRACAQSFAVYASALSGKTNATGNFCSRKCYDAWLCKAETSAARGSRWRAIRTEALARVPFCALCGQTHRLQVHHVLPWRERADNRLVNLVPLCVRHHKFVEEVTRRVLATGLSPEITQLALRSILFEHQQRIAATVFA